MNFNDYEDFIKYAESLGYVGFNTENNNTNNTRDYSEGCNDTGGFQTVPPELFSIIGQIVGMSMAGRMPFNVQNAIGNWLQLVGQIILTYNAQQQYFQSGPGRFYNTKYYNVQNPFCPQNEDANGSDKESNELKELKKSVKALTREVQQLKNEIEKMK